MCQQIFTRQEYDGMLEQYAEDKRSQSLADEDLDGFPSNDYCFIGLYSLIDRPLDKVPDAIVKAQRAQIRVAMVTSDHPTTAKAIAKQINILSPEISEMSGTDTFQIEHDANGQAILNLYRNNQLLKQHVASQVMRLDPENQNAISMMKQTQIDAKPNQEPPWYKRAWASCRNQFSEPKSDLPKVSKMECIPYAIVVSLYLVFFYPCQTFA
jgi:magnesium-transporting ATPase (P-type)